MKNTEQEELLADAINHLTEKASSTLLKEFLKLPEDQQSNFVIIKSAQLLLANILCQVATDANELAMIIDTQSDEIKSLTLDCANTAYSKKFSFNKH